MPIIPKIRLSIGILTAGKKSFVTIKTTLTKDQFPDSKKKYNPIFPNTGISVSIMASARGWHSTIYVWGNASETGERESPYADALGLTETIDAGDTNNSNDGLAVSGKNKSSIAITVVAACSGTQLIDYNDIVKNSENAINATERTTITESSSISESESIDNWKYPYLRRQKNLEC